MLEQNITKKKQVDKIISQIQFKESNNKKYKVEVIWDSMIYINELKD